MRSHTTCTCTHARTTRTHAQTVLDEATASLDEGSDRAIQAALASSFPGCTILVVAHRLRTVIESHQIVALSGGRLVECGAPSGLLEREGGVLAALVADHGAEEAQELRAMARRAEQQRQQQQQQQQQESQQ
jgi:ABC-type transport system involved in cytochrome bd biosynthesis fused ATPase/permease subunit